MTLTARALAKAAGLSASDIARMNFEEEQARQERIDAHNRAHPIAQCRDLTHPDELCSACWTNHQQEEEER